MFGLLKIVKPFFLLVLLLSVLSMSGCHMFRAKYEKSETKDYTVSGLNKTKISIENISGRIKVRKNTTDSTVIIRTDITSYVEKRDLDNNFNPVKINIDTAGTEINVSGEVAERKSFFNFGFNKGSRINYEILVPSNMSVDLDNTNGGIDISEVNGNINVDITNGDVKISKVTGECKVDVTNGKITSELDSTKGLNFSSVNGSINLTLGNSFSGRFDVDVVNGKVKRDNVKFTDVETEKKSFKGKLGNSEVDVKLSTVNGSVNIKPKE